MADWQERVVMERNALGEKVGKLKEFLDSNPLIAEAELMELQYHAMVSYLTVLNMRIRAF